jgi:pyrroloquinoline quinone (PQQ) biosynthesis protein C
MKWPWEKRDNYVYTWESEPFAFQKGAIYVIEVNTDSVKRDEVAKLQEFFMYEGVTVHMVASLTGKALNPIKVKRKKEEV